MVRGNLSLLRYKRIDRIDLICHFSREKIMRIMEKFELVEELKMNNKELVQSGYQLRIN